MSSACGETGIWTPYLLHRKQDWYHYTTEPIKVLTANDPLKTSILIWYWHNAVVPGINNVLSKIKLQIFENKLLPDLYYSH